VFVISCQLQCKCLPANDLLCVVWDIKLLTHSLCMLQLIPPRGCAYVCFALRRDASRALDKLKGYKLNGNLLKVSRDVFYSL